MIDFIPAVPPANEKVQDNMADIIYLHNGKQNNAKPNERI